MSDRENGQQPLPGRGVRNKISADIWEQIKAGYAAGINLREIARKIKIPEGTVLAHAKRHGWTQQIQAHATNCGFCATRTDAQPRRDVV